MAILQEILKISLLDMSLKMTNLKLQPYLPGANKLSHWGRVTHICVSELTIIGSDNGLSPGRRQAIIWTNAGLLLNEPLGTNASEISIGIHTFSFKKMHLNMSSAKWRPFCLGLNVLIEDAPSLTLGHLLWAQCLANVLSFTAQGYKKYDVILDGNLYI